MTDQGSDSFASPYVFKLSDESAERLGDGRFEEVSVRSVRLLALACFVAKTRLAENSRSRYHPPRFSNLFISAFLL